MCDPITAAVVVGVTSVIGTGATLIQQASVASAQRQAINQQAEVVSEENRKAASAEIFDRMRAARREQGRIRVAAGEAGLGLSSGSVGQLLMDSAMQSELSTQRSLANRESRDAANSAEAASMLSRVQGPTLASAGIQIASSAAGAWSDISRAKVQKRQGG